jgi:hypothetical protein
VVLLLWWWLVLLVLLLVVLLVLLLLVLLLLVLLLLLLVLLVLQILLVLVLLWWLLVLVLLVLVLVLMLVLLQVLSPRYMLWCSWRSAFSRYRARSVSGYQALALHRSAAHTSQGPQGLETSAISPTACLPLLHALYNLMAYHSPTRNRHFLLAVGML